MMRLGKEVGGGAEEGEEVCLLGKYTHENRQMVTKNKEEEVKKCSSNVFYQCTL